ncbi:MAG: glutaredoxin family protein [Spirochaetes bacterium]|nr:glutaredoxin family protein [Spirochaetota bacterium]
MDLHGLNFTGKEGARKDHDIVVYALSTCGHCRRALEFLKERDLAYRYIYVDLLPFETKNAIKTELKDRFRENVAFPFAVIDNTSHLVGFIEPDWILSLGLGEKP